MVVNCEYASWGDWTECDKPCGGGNQIRTRKAVRQAWYGGTKCTDADSKEEQACNIETCPGNIIYSHLLAKYTKKYNLF